MRVCCEESLPRARSRFLTRPENQNRAMRARARKCMLPTTFWTRRHALRTMTEVMDLLSGAIQKAETTQDS